MNQDPDVPQSTLRVLASLLVLAFDIAREKAADVIEKVIPLVEPPRDLQVSSRLGTLYSGVIVLDRGDVIAGIVVATGQTMPSVSSAVASAMHRPPLVTPPARETHLPSWADDPRELYDDREPPPWRR